MSGRLLNFFSPIKGDVLGQKPIGVIKGGEEREQHNPGGLSFLFNSSGTEQVEKVERGG